MTTIILSLIVMCGLFLMLIAGVAFIQDKKYFTSAPKEIQDVIEPKEERFRGQHMVGWILMLVAMLLMAGPLVYAGVDGVRNGFTYGQFFLRYVIIFLLLKAFDILFFDWFLLCHSNFYSHFFPECKSCLGPQLFGFNKKSHMLQIVLLIIASAVIAGLCSLIFC